MNQSQNTYKSVTICIITNGGHVYFGCQMYTAHVQCESGQVKGNMNNPRLDSTLYRVYVPTSICTKSKKSKKSIDLVIPHYSDHISTEANIHIQSRPSLRSRACKIKQSHSLTYSRLRMRTWVSVRIRRVLRPRARKATHSCLLTSAE